MVPKDNTLLSNYVALLSVDVTVTCYHWSFRKVTLSQAAPGAQPVPLFNGYRQIVLGLGAGVGGVGWNIMPLKLTSSPPSGAEV